MDDLNLLISGYLDDELTEAQRDRFATVLPNDVASINHFADVSFIHYQLLDWMNGPHQQDRETPLMFGDLAACDAGSELRTASNAASPQRARARTRFRDWSPGILAATVLLVATISLLGYRLASRPVIVGLVSGATGSRWAGPDLAVGALLQEDQELALVEGSAVITFVSGAQILLEAPAKLRLDSAKEVQLLSGRMAAKVPTPARGFAVTCSLARFVDLGTEFTLNLVAEKSFELHVFEGLVELHLDDQFGDAAMRPLRVAEVRAMSFDVAKGDVEPLHFQEGKQMPF